MIKWSLVLAAIFLMWRSPARAGNDAGGGDTAIVCRSTEGNIVSAQTLDLYEAHLQGILLRKPKGHIEDEYIAYLEARSDIEFANPSALSDLERGQAIDYLHTMLNEYFHFTGPGEQVPPSNDLGTIPPIPPGCALEQLAFFDDVKLRTFVNSEIWNSLDSLNQAALYVHEHYYRRYRMAGDVDSHTVRRIVAWAFASVPVARVVDGVPSDAFYCSAQGNDLEGETWFYLYQDPKDPGQTILQFQEFMGRDTFSPTKIRVPVRIKVSSLRGADGGLVVVDSKAKFDDQLALTDGPFDSYFPRVRYVFDEPFSFEFQSHDGIVRKSFVNQCNASRNHQ